MVKRNCVKKEKSLNVLSKIVYLQNKSVKYPDFLHVGTNSGKLKVDKIFLGGHGQKSVWPVWSWDFKIDCTSRMIGWNEVIFCMLVEIQERLVISLIFECVWSKMGVVIYLVYKTLKSDVS